MILRILTFVLAAAHAAAQDVSPPEERFLTIGTEGRTLVREVRNATLVAGENRLRVYGFSPRLDPLTVHVRDLTSPRRLSFVSQSVWFEILDVDRALESLVGREVTVFREFGLTREEITGNLLSPPVVPTPDGERRVPLFIEKPDGDIRLIEDAELDLDLDEFPRGEWNRVRLDWIVTSASAGPSRFELLYWTDGIGFEHGYRLRLSADSSRADLLGTASIHNDTGVALPGCTVQLATEAGLIRAFHAVDPAVRATAGVYPLPTLVDLESRRRHQVTFASGHDLPVQVRPSLFPGADPGRGGGDVPIRRRLILANTAATRLGQPLPAGTVEVLQIDELNRPLRLNTARIDDTAVNEPLWIAADVVPGVAARRSQSLQLGERGPIRLVTVHLHSERSEALEVDVLERLTIGETVRTASVTPDLRRAGWAVLTVQVPGRASATLTYTVERE